MKRLRLVIPLTMLIVACGSDETKQNNTISINNVNNVNNGNNANNGTNQNPADAREQSIVDAFNAPQNTNDAAEGALSLTVESVVTASIVAI